MAPTNPDSDLVARIVESAGEHGHGCIRCAQVAIDTLRNEGWMDPDQIGDEVRDAQERMED